MVVTLATKQVSESECHAENDGKYPDHHDDREKQQSGSEHDRTVAVTRWVEGPSVTSAAKSGANAIVIKNFSFTPARLTVVAGTTVTVTNTDQVPHTLTSGDGGFDTGEIGVGKKATIALQRLGTFTYSCQIHPSMAGTLGVK